MEEGMRETVRLLRKKQTESEKAFWECVRNRKLGVKFLRQFAIPFTYEGRKRYFIADFYCSEKKLAVEIDGTIHEKQKEYDRLRSYIINQLGIKVIRFKNEELKDIEISNNRIEKAFINRPCYPSLEKRGVRGELNLHEFGGKSCRITLILTT